MPQALRPRDPFVDHLMELMAPVAARVGPITARRMFGGHGLYYDGLMFGLVSGGRCYLKTDARTRAAYEEAGCEPFRYRSRGRDITIGAYFAVPAQCLESPQEMSAWARAAMEATLRLANAPGAR
ncbi:TfoX/Sxy family protein [Cupriavidus respiraculi]|uniref:DNA transformation protein TfoX1 n=1 Tax=Cupriavidus respiraculi TaxID=195930 RepID=A0ABN7Z4K7_9BURK|nr:TfoX/Sxy family protein [Cupriavidus respiraculi]CAG9179321.1 DNA transformation protein TfoX1 [Cupriavidus respiraculi]